MSPFQHGEVFVTEDGAETDLDIGHYERFLDQNLAAEREPHPGGDLGHACCASERKGDYLGKTVQVIPHITDEIKDRIRRSAEQSDADVVISEIGGTVGDIESLPFLEAIRQFRREAGAENVLYLHVTLVPFVDAAGELKTKPTQHSVNELRRIGIHPDVVVCRSRDVISRRHPRQDRALRRRRAGGRDRQRGRLGRVPRARRAAGAGPRRPRLPRSSVCPRRHADLGEWLELTERIRQRDDRASTIALVGKYVKLHDAYLSVHEALKHAGIHHGCHVSVRWVDAEGMSLEEAQRELESVDGVLVPGGFGSRGWEGKILACRVAREHGDPVPRHLPRHARRRLRVRPPRASASRARTRPRWIPRRRIPVIDLLPEQKEVEDLGGTMRLGAQAVELAEGTRAHEAYGEPVVHERHRHRYEVNNHYRPQLVDAGLVVSGTFQEGRLVEIVELPDHPWFVASQFHPEFKSRPTRPAPLFREFVGAALDRAARERAGRQRARAASSTR